MPRIYQHPRRSSSTEMSVLADGGQVVFILGEYFGFSRYFSANKKGTQPVKSTQSIKPSVDFSAECG